MTPSALRANPPVRVTHILTDANVGGAGTHLFYLLSAADRERFDYSVILPEGTAMAERIRRLGVPVTEVPGIADRSRAPAARKTLREALTVLRPDVVHTHASLTGRLAARDCGVPVRVMTRHSSDLPPRQLTRFPGKTLCRLHYRRTVTAAIATSGGARASLLAGGMPEERIRLIPNGALPLRTVSEDEKAALRRRLELPEDCFVVGSFARLEPEKAHETLLRAAALVARMTRDVYFLIVGDGSRRSELKELARRYGIGSNVRFCGFAEDVAPYMSLCRVNVNTSERVETSNLALTEGLSMGLIPVVSDLPGNREIAGEEGTGCGIVCRRGEPPEFADAILSLCRDHANIRFLSDAARREFTGRTAEKMARSTEEVYLEALTASAHSQKPIRDKGGI